MSQYPRVTEVLSVVARFQGIPPEIIARAAAVGTEVHKYGLAYARGYYLEPPENVAAYVARFREWVDFAVEEVFEVETEVRSTAFRYVGHVDLVARLRGDTMPAILDLKRVAVVDPIVGLQLAAYHQAVSERYEVGRRLAIWIPPTLAECKAIEFGDANDFPAFLNALSLFHHLRKGKK
jgi:hypothetical protein